jgi:biopolymer transport protein ExbD
MGRLRKKKELDVEVDVGAFADIAFLLIIFFILTTSLTKTTGQQVEIPSAQTPPEKQVDEKTPTINLLADSILFGEDEESMEDIGLEELETILLAKELDKAEETKRMVVLEVAEDVIYDRYFKVVTLISRAGGIVAMVEDSE